MVAHTGHRCGEDFRAEPFLKAHLEYEYLRPILKKMKAGPWMTFAVEDFKNPTH